MKAKTGGAGSAPAVVTMAMVEEYRWDVTAETAVDFVATTATTHESSETGLTNSVVGYAGASVFRVGASGLEVTKSSGSPYYIVDVGDHIDLGDGHAFYPMEWVTVVTRVDYDLPTAGDTITVASIGGINGDGIQAQIQNIGGVVKVFPQRTEPSASGSASAVTLNGGATTGTVWIWHEIAGATHRIAYKATEPTSWADGTNLLTPEMISESDTTITTTDLDDGYRYYVQVTGASGAGFVVPTMVFCRYQAVDAATIPPTTVNGTELNNGVYALTVRDASTDVAVGTVNAATGVTEVTVQNEITWLDLTVADAFVDSIGLIGSVGAYDSGTKANTINTAAIATGPHLTTNTARWEFALPDVLGEVVKLSTHWVILRCFVQVTQQPTDTDLELLYGVGLAASDYSQKGVIVTGRDGAAYNHGALTISGSGLYAAGTAPTRVCGAVVCSPDYWNNVASTPYNAAGAATTTSRAELVNSALGTAVALNVVVEVGARIAKARAIDQIKVKFGYILEAFPLNSAVGL